MIKAMKNLNNPNRKDTHEHPDIRSIFENKCGTLSQLRSSGK
jgi:hypothetical protein